MSNTKTLLDLTFDGDLAGFIATERTAGTSWRTVADKVNARIPGVTVSHEFLRLNYPDSSAAA